MKIRQRTQGAHLQGQAVVEFALLAPILVIMLLGTVDTGMLVNTKSVVSYATRQGAQLLETNESSANIIQSITTTLLAAHLSLNNLQSITFFRANAEDGNATPQAGVNPDMNLVFSFTNGSISSVNGIYTDTIRTGNDYAGINIQYKYIGMTPLYDSGVVVGDVNSIRIDPPGNIYRIPTPLVPTPLPTSTPAPAFTPYPTLTPRPTYTQPPTATPTMPAATGTAVPTSTPGAVLQVFQVQPSPVANTVNTVYFNATIMTTYDISASVSFGLESQNGSLIWYNTSASNIGFIANQSQMFTASIPYSTLVSSNSAYCIPISATCTAQAYIVIQTTSGKVLLNQNNFTQTFTYGAPPG